MLSVYCSIITTVAQNRSPFYLFYSFQHFPLYRDSDAVCAGDEDAPPLPERNKKFRTKIDSLSKEATDYLTKKIKPRVVFGGHTHHGCLLKHADEDVGVEFDEYSLPSFSWRNRPNPKYMLVSELGFFKILLFDLA